DASLVAYPGLIGGGVAVTGASRLQGAEANGLAELWRGECFRAHLVAGFRFLQLDEDLAVTEAERVNPGAPVALAGNGIVVVDQCEARNEFYGGQVGVRGEFRWRRWTVEGLAKVALGDCHETVTIGGATFTAPPGGLLRAAAGGLLALPSNSGRFNRDAF